MDGCSRQNPAYRPAEERAPLAGALSSASSPGPAPQRDLGRVIPTFPKLSPSEHIPIEIRFISGADVDALTIGPDLILEATERALKAQGEHRVVLEPREHLVPDPAFDGHFNLLRAYIAPLDVAGVKVVGDFHGNFKLGLPSELALLTLYDPRTGVPRAIVDATAITEWRTGAVTALGGRHLGAPDAKVLGHVGARGTAFSNVTLLDRVHDFDEIRVTSARPESRAAFGARLEAALGKPVRVVRLDRGDRPRRRHRRRGDPAHRARADHEDRVARPRHARHALRDDERGRARPRRQDGQGLRRRLGPVPGRPLRRAARARRGRPGHRRVDRGRARRRRRGDAAGRESPGERILFWHRGLATTDIALGQAILDRAVERDVGTLLPYR